MNKQTITFLPTDMYVSSVKGVRDGNFLK